MVRLRTKPALLALALMTASATASGVDSFTAEYDLSRGFVTLGRMTRELTIDPEQRYVFTSRMHAKGLVALFTSNEVVEKSSGRIVDARFRPDTYLYDKNGTKRDYALTFDYDSNTVARDGTEWRADMPEGLLDKLSYQAQLMFDLAAAPHALDYPIADKGKLKQYAISMLGQEVVETPLGRFETLKLERADDDSPRRTRVWCAQSLGWLPVRVEHRDKRGETTVAVISKLQRMP